MELKAEAVLIGETGDVKSSLSKLYSMSAGERKNIDRLSFRNQYQGYSAGAVEEYLSRLPNLEYIELLGNDLKFIGVMPVEGLKGKEYEFVNALRDGTVLINFGQSVVTESVDYNTSAINLQNSNAKLKNAPLLFYKPVA